MIGSDADFLWASDFGVRRILPIHMKLPNQDRIVLHHFLQLRAARSHDDVRRSLRRKFLPIQICVIQKIHAVNDHALFAGWLAFQHFLAFSDAGMLLNYFVAGAGGNVVAVGPDGRSRVVRKEGAQKLVTIVRTQRIRTRADGITHRVGSLWTRLGIRPAWLWRRRSCARSRHEQRVGHSGLSLLAGHTDLCGFAVAAGPWLIGPDLTAAKCRHHDQPAIRELIITNYSIAIVGGFARAAKAFEDRVGCDRAVQDLAGRGELLSLLCKNCYACV